MPKYPSWKKVRLTQKSLWNEMDLHFWKIHGAHVRAVKKWKTLAGPKMPMEK